MSIGERITELRKKRNITQSDLAKVLDVSRQAVSKWENGLTSPDTVNLIRLADVLDTDVEYLATGQTAPAKIEPVVVKIVEKVDNVVEKVVEKPVVVEKIVEVEKVINSVVEKPVLKKVFRVKYLRNPIEFAVVGIICFILGIIVGLLV